MTPDQITSALDDATTTPAPESGRAVAFSTGSLMIDSALALRGLPLHQVTHIQGDVMTGKSTLLYRSIASAQAAGLTVALIEMRPDFHPEYAAAQGIKLNELLLVRPDSNDLKWRLLRQLRSDVLAIDGIDAQYQADAVVDLPGRTVVATTNCYYLDRVFTPALPYTAIRIALSAAGPVSGGIRVSARVLKDAYSPPREITPKVYFDLRHGTGIDTTGELLNLAVMLGLIQRVGGWYTLGHGAKVQGREAAIEKLKAQPGFCVQLTKSVRAQLEQERQLP